MTVASSACEQRAGQPRLAADALKCAAEGNVRRLGAKSNDGQLLTAARHHLRKVKTPCESKTSGTSSISRVRPSGACMIPWKTGKTLTTNAFSQSASNKMVISSVVLHLPIPQRYLLWIDGGNMPSS
jgi:hypothetical protein